MRHLFFIIMLFYSINSFGQDTIQYSDGISKGIGPKNVFYYNDIPFTGVVKMISIPTTKPSYQMQIHRKKGQDSIVYFTGDTLIEYFHYSKGKPHGLSQRFDKKLNFLAQENVIDSSTNYNSSHIRYYPNGKIFIKSVRKDYLTDETWEYDSYGKLIAHTKNTPKKTVGWRISKVQIDENTYSLQKTSHKIKRETKEY